MQRYGQQMMIPEVGAEGQKKLAAAKVLVIGAGGLGTPVAVYLAGAGVGTIGIMDGDNISPSNLPRQFLFHEAEAGRSKSTVLSERINKQNPLVLVLPVVEMIDEQNAVAQISRYDIICDCTDNAVSRILIDKTCGQLQKPLVYAVARGWEGYVTVLHHKKKITLEDIFLPSGLHEGEMMSCTMAGIIGPVCGIAGSLQAAEVIKVLLDMESALDGGILCIDASRPSYRLFRLNTQAAARRSMQTPD